jgi:predicted RNase H-like HicB family nuclease
MVHRVEVEREDDGRWLADVTDLPGVMAYAETAADAYRAALALAFRVLADRIEHGEATVEPLESVSFTRVG